MLRHLANSDLLRLWEFGIAQHPIRWAIELLSAQHGLEADEVAAWTIGRRDRALLEFYIWAFGSKIECLGRCPDCESEVEIEAAGDQILNGLTVADDEVYRLSGSEGEICFRPPNSEDQLVAVELIEPRAARAEIIRRCLCEADSANCGEPPTMGKRQEEQLEEAMAAADAAARIEFPIQCPDCDKNWQLGFDIVCHLWAAFDRWASRILADTHRIAAAYGWSENEILALGATRRQAYLKLIAHGHIY